MGTSKGSGYEIRQGLLGQAQSILEQNAHMQFEQTKIWSTVTTEDIITEAEKLYQFVQKRD
tara:strand:+ start:627 stop:809 length:183 start_codon:yes stop_codon:yes gene_type:complete